MEVVSKIMCQNGQNNNAFGFLNIYFESHKCINMDQKTNYKTSKSKLYNIKTHPVNDSNFPRKKTLQSQKYRKINF